MATRQVQGKPASIKDVAALAQVSVPTVSRYLNNRDRVSEEKRTRIANAIALLDYRPNPIARALVRERTKMVAVLSTNTTLFGQSQTIYGIEQKAQQEGYSLNIDVLVNSVNSVLDQNPVGIILLNYDELSNQAFELLPPNVPTVMIAGNRRENTAQVSMQERQGGYELTKYMLSLGHRTVYHITIPGGGGGYTRLAGWRQALEEAGAPIPMPVDASWDPEDGRTIGRQIAADESVTAVFVGNDELAMGVIRGLGDAGKRVPEDVSVAGFDDHPIGRVWNPSLTTIHQDFRIAGERAFEMLQTEIEDIDSGRGHTDSWDRYIEVPGHLIIRESTGQVSADRHN